jgi:hypothetical protein
MAYDFTPEQAKEILDRLAAPFDLRLVKWRVTATNKEKTKGLVAPYADPRSYQLRLNEVLSAAGWSCEYQTQTISGVSLNRDGRNVTTGKIMVVATLEIYGIGRKSSMGEKWADDDNAVTAAEAQAFKRAASQFGLGKYFYDLKEAGVNLWVPIDERKVPKQVPQLPPWAVPAGTQQGAPQQQERTQQPPQQQQQRQQNNAPRPQQGSQQPSPGTGQGSAAPTSQAHFEAAKQSYLEELGQPLYASITSTLDRMIAEGKVTGDRYGLLVRKMEDQRKLLRAVRTAAADMPIPALDAALERFHVKRLDLIPNYAVLYDIAKEFGVVPDTSGKAA